MAADRAACIDQSQSLNIFMSVPTKAKVTSMHFYGWKKGMKTGMYYLRTQPATNAIQFTVDHEKLKATSQTEKKLPANGKEEVLPSIPSIPLTKSSDKVSQRMAMKMEIETLDMNGPVCRMEEGCLMCGS